MSKKTKNNSNGSASKTSAIRAELKKTSSPKEVAKRLNARGIKVSAQYVSTIKSSDKKRASSGIMRAKPGRPPKSAYTNGRGGELQQAGDLMIQAIDLVVKAGPNQARELVNMAERILQRTGS